MLAAASDRRNAVSAATSSGLTNRQVEPHHGRPAASPESRRLVILIDVVAPENSVSAAHLANSPVGMGRPSPLFARCSAHSIIGRAVNRSN